MTKTHISFAAILLSISSLCCMAATPTCTPAEGYPDFALGADVSWTPYIERNNLHTYYKSNTIAANEITTIPAMVYDHGIDAVRLRVWVDPDAPMALSGFYFTADGWGYDQMSTFGTCSPDEMAALARRFAEQGQRIMVVFQMSDTWADPARQFIPSAWAGCRTADELSAKAVEHVLDVLEHLREQNVNVAWVQIGNETNTGMLKYPLPKADNSAVSPVAFGCGIGQDAPGKPNATTHNFVKVYAAAARAARTIYPEAKTVLHLTNTCIWDNVNWTLSMLKAAGLTGASCDYIGLSLYPGLDDGKSDYTALWPEYAEAALTTIRNIYDTYGYRTMLCEIGMNNEYSLSANTAGVAASGLQKCYIRQCNTDVRAFTEYLIQHLDRPDSTCDGLFYWEPETDYMKGYTKGACVSATPGASWPRDKVTPNTWWTTVRDHSTFPKGGLIDYSAGISDPTMGDPSFSDPFPKDPNISRPSSTSATNTATEYYNLQGIRIPRPSSGLYIERHGRKTTLKFQK